MQQRADSAVFGVGLVIGGAGFKVGAAVKPAVGAVPALPGEAAINTVNSVKVFPPNFGFVDSIPPVSQVQPGLYSRFGSLEGSFVAPLGTPAAQRSLLPGTGGKEQIIRLLEPVDGHVGLTAPAYNQPGKGIQIMFTNKINALIKEGKVIKIEQLPIKPID